MASILLDSELCRMKERLHRLSRAPDSYYPTFRMHNCTHLLKGAAAQRIEILCYCSNMVSGDLEGPANGERDGDIDEDPCLNRKGRKQSPFWFGRLGDLEGLADGVSDRDSMRQSLETGPAPASGNITLLSRAWNYQHDDGKPLDDACQLGWSGWIISTCFQIFATDKQHGLNPTMTISLCQPPPGNPRNEVHQTIHFRRWNTHKAKGVWVHIEFE